MFAHDRYLLVKAKSTGKDPLVDRILNGELSEEYAACLKSFKSPIRKSYIESALLASRDLEAISNLLEIATEIIELYRDLFFNVVGVDKLGLMEIIEDSATLDERAIKIWSLNQGLDFVAFRLGKVVHSSPIESLQELHTMALYKAKEGLFSGNASESSAQALKWTKQATDTARLLKMFTTDASAARADLELAIQATEVSFEGFDSLDQDDTNGFGS